MQEQIEYPIIKMYSTASNFPQTRLRQMSYGDIIYYRPYDSIKYKYKVGQYFHAFYHEWLIIKIYYKPRKWWQFWKKREIIGLELMYT